LHTWLPVVIARVFSVIQASSMRERFYTLQNRNEILETALDDIKRIANSDTSVETRVALIQGIVANTVDR
jgi:predicted KAP-like P-loop ATPase